MTEETVSHETFAQGLNDRVLHCRELGHTWRAWGVKWERTQRAYVRTLRCAQCKTLRHMVVDSSGFIVTSHYTYPKGYLAQHVEKGLRRDVFRLEAITREIDKLERDSA